MKCKSYTFAFRVKTTQLKIACYMFNCLCDVSAKTYSESATKANESMHADYGLTFLIFYSSPLQFKSKFFKK